jgi:glycosyltransferase involved in cell wall biosynthesis
VGALRVAVIADMREERWPSMDLVAEMLVERLQANHGKEVTAELVRPAMHRRVSGPQAAKGVSFNADRLLNRFYDYPRLARQLHGKYEVFHIVDHSYAQLVHALPAARTLVTCHDLDTFRSVIEPRSEWRSLPFRVMTRRILSGLRCAGHIACDTEATRDGLVARVGLDPSRTTVIHNGPHPSCTPYPETVADAQAARLLGRRSSEDLLHVGSTIARKRLDTLLRVFANIRRSRPDARLIRVGGPFTADQRALVREFALEDAIVVLPFLDRSTLAAVYRRSAVLLLPSEREGFGLPVLEALACGTPVIASDIEALREVGGTAVLYCPSDDVESWTTAVLQVLEERMEEPARWGERRTSGIARAAAFSWSQYAVGVVPLYRMLAGASPSRPGAGGSTAC